MARILGPKEISERAKRFRFPDFMRFAAVSEGLSSCEMLTAGRAGLEVEAARFGRKVFVNLPEAGDEAHAAELAYELIEKEIRARKGPEYDFMAIFTPTQTMTRTMHRLYARQEAALEWRESYYVKPDWEGTRIAAPKGYSLEWLSSDLLAGNFANTDELLEEMISERPSVEDFLDKGFGICAVKGREIAGWCLSEYNNAEGCEIGIGVMKEHRHKGLASAMTSLFLKEAALRGAGKVGWDCHRQNAPSWRTAQKAGFTLSSSYPTVLICKDRTMQYGANGNIALRDGDGDAALAWYKKAIARGDAPYWIFINMAQVQAITGDIRLVMEAFEGLKCARYDE